MLRGKDNDVERVKMKVREKYLVLEVVVMGG